MVDFEDLYLYWIRGDVIKFKYLKYIKKNYPQYLSVKKIEYT